MTRIITTILLALSASTASAGCRWEPGDSFRAAQDKRRHYAAELVGGLSVEAVNAGLDLALTPAQRFGITMLPGAVREVSQACRGHGGSRGDIAWNALGALTAVAIGEGVRVMLQPRGVLLAVEMP